MDDNAQTRLEYAAAPARTPVRRRHIAIAVLGFAVVTSPFWGMWIFHRATLVYWQRRCMTYTAAPTTVIWEPDPREAKKLLAQNNYLELIPFTAGAVAEPWSRFAQSLSSVGLSPMPYATAFSHERTSGAGKRRLVVVDVFSPAKGPPPSPASVSAQVFEPGNVVALPVRVANPTFSLPRAGNRFLDLHRTRIFAGQVDPVDASHFTIGYERDGGLGQIEGYLNADDSVTLQPHDLEEKK